MFKEAFADELTKLSVWVAGAGPGKARLMSQHQAVPGSVKLLFRPSLNRGAQHAGPVPAPTPLHASTEAFDPAAHVYSKGPLGETHKPTKMQSGKKDVKDATKIRTERIQKAKDLYEKHQDKEYARQKGVAPAGTSPATNPVTKLRDPVVISGKDKKSDPFNASRLNKTIRKSIQARGTATSEQAERIKKSRDLVSRHQPRSIASMSGTEAVRHVGRKFVSGARRFGAGAKSWLFKDISGKDAKDKAEDKAPAGGGLREPVGVTA